VISDDIPEMIEQARLISSWGANVYVKLPVTTSRGEPLFKTVRALSHDGVKVNLTAVFTAEQVADGIDALSGGAPVCLSVFAGRLADAGIDYRPIMRDAVRLARATANVDVIWASTREVFNVIEANEMQCHIITAPAVVLKKLPSLGTKTAAELSLDAVRTFRKDAESAALTACWNIGRMTEPCKLENALTDALVLTRAAARRVVRSAHRMVTSYRLFDSRQILGTAAIVST
jgi:transaldolase